jgi:predicted amidophosphoribosyltransferase
MGPCAADRPRKLRRLDAGSSLDHPFLSATDSCAYVAEFVSGRSYRAGGLNQLILNFKCTPSAARANPQREHYKRHAIATLAHRLRLAVSRTEAEQSTWVPIPPSRSLDDPDFDDRLSRTLSLAFDSYDVDVRGLLYQVRNTPSDHAADVRLSADMLYELLHIDVAALGARPIRERIALFDDVLTTGKHFKCCERRLRQSLPCVPIAGVFLLRRVLARSRCGPDRA